MAALLFACKSGDAGSGDAETSGPGGSEGPDAGDAGIVVERGPAVGRRLIREEYFNSIEVALGVQLDASSFDVPEDFRLPSGFRNSAAELLLSPKRIEAFEAIATAAATTVDIAALIAEHASCTELSDVCYAGFIGDLGLRLLRRPVPAVERDIYARLFAVAADEGEGFDAGARLVVRAMLQSPRFVYRLEAQGSGAGETTSLRTIDDYELAIRLAFLIWNAAPDLELMRLADASGLSDAFDTQIDRLLADPRARRALRQYVEQWLYLEAVSPNLLLRAAAQEETYHLFERVVWEDDLDFMEAFVDKRAELSPELAEFYGLTPLGPGAATYDLSALPERIGFTTHAAVMAAHTINPDSSIIDRGLFILGDVLCDSVPPPEGDALEEAITETAIPPESGLSQRDRFAMQRENPLCAGCHGVFDPLGLPYEAFGPAGEFMSEDRFGNPLTGQSNVAIGDVVGDFADVGEFVRAVAQSETVARCMVSKSLQHAWGRVLRTQDDPLIDELAAQFGAAGRSYQELLRTIAHHPDFRVVETAKP